MRLPQFQTRKWNYLALSFALPVIGILSIMIIGGYTPFGKYSMLYSDMYHQYYPFFKAFREALRSGDSLLYNWSVGLGIDYLGLISYYLASPLNLLSVLVPEGWLLSYFSLMMPVKLGLASLFFAIFLKQMFGQNDWSLPLFGCLYGMCAWALGYQWNIMWLDTFALLPLTALGTVQLLRDKKVVLYTVTLFLSVFINYYIGFFTCIFVLLLFICYQICRCKSLKRLCADFVRIGIFTVLAIGMTAILELPALAALQNTQSSVNTFPEGFSVNIVSGEAVTAAREAWKAYEAAKEAGEGGLWGLWFDAVKASFPPLLEAMRQVAGNMGGGLTPTFKEGLPNLYCGVGTIVFAFLFLTSRHVKLRDKICSVVLLVFFMLSFIFRQLDYIWHGFHFTNMIPYRFSFLFSFVMLYMAYRAFLLRHRFKLWQVILAGLLGFGIICCSDAVTQAGDAGEALGNFFSALLSLDKEQISAAASAIVSSSGPLVYLAYNLVFWGMYTGILVFSQFDRKLPAGISGEELRRICANRIRRRETAAIALAVVVGMELVVNTVNFGVQFPCTAIYNYPNGTKYTASVIRYMKEREEDTLFYRAEVTHSQTLNDGALNGYNGISTFTSSANVRVTEFMKDLGFAAKNTYNRYCYEEASPVSNLFLNLKYMIERDGRVEENSYFEEVYHYEKAYLLENLAYLPLGFLAESDLADLNFAETNSAFNFQNKLFTAATGIHKDVWYNIPGSWVTVTPYNASIGSQSNGYVSYKADASSGTIVYSYAIDKAGFMCLDLNMPSRNSFTIKKNGTELYSDSISLAQTASVCEVVPGDVIEVHVKLKGSENSTMTVRAALLQDDVFWEGYDILNASTLELTKFSNTKVEGTIACNRDGLLYTSIPHDGNWRVTVDGKEVEHALVGDAMIAVELTEGEHTVTFIYRNEAFSLGWKISLLCLLVFIAILVGKEYWKSTRYQGKFRK